MQKVIFLQGPSWLGDAAVVVLNQEGPSLDSYKRKSHKYENGWDASAVEFQTVLVVCGQQIDKLGRTDLGI